MKLTYIENFYVPDTVLNVYMRELISSTLSGRWGFPGGARGKEPYCQCRRRKRCGFDLWVGKIPWRKAWQPTPVFLSGESHGQRSLGLQSIDSQTVDTLKRLRTHTGG